MIESCLIISRNVAGSQGKHYGDNYTDGCLALVEHIINGKKDCREETPNRRARRLHCDDQINIGLGSTFRIHTVSQSSARFNHC